MAEEQRKTVLIVDDTPVHRKLVEVTLSQFPFSYQAAANGLEAYESIKRQKPDILITDVIMHSSHGGTLLEKLFTSPEGQIIIPTLVLTGTPDEPEAIKALFYASRMYTEEQRAALGIQVFQTLEEQRAWVKRTFTPRTPDLGFVGLFKPYDINDIIGRTQQILKAVYGIDNKIQS